MTAWVTGCGWVTDWELPGEPLVLAWAKALGTGSVVHTYPPSLTEGRSFSHRFGLPHSEMGVVPLA